MSKFDLTISLMINSEMFNKIKQEADNNQISVSAQIRMYILEHFKNEAK